MQSSKNKYEYDRSTLENFINQYLEALSKNDPSGLPLANGVKFVENNQELQTGDGTWNTVTGLGVYRHYFVDLLTGQSAVICVVEENGRNVILNLRLKISNGKISEIESLVVRDSNGAENYEKLGQPPSLFLATIPEERRKPRESLIGTANLYFSGMEYNDPKGDYSFFADRCNRMENGRITSNAEPTEYGHSTDSDFVTMSCREQFETGFLGFVTRIRDRRFFVIDEECQSVISFAYFDHDGTIRKIDMPNDKTFVIPPYFSTPRTLQVCEAFRVENEQLQFIEVTMTELPYGTRPKWDTEKDQWLRKSNSMNTDDSQKADGSMGRDQLNSFVDQFLVALVSRDVRPHGIADSVKYTENGQQLDIGDGLWGTASEIGEYKVVLAEPETGSVGFFGCIKEYDVDSFLTVRLKIQNGEIIEIEALVMRNEYFDERLGTVTLFGPRLEGLYKRKNSTDLPGVFGQILPPNERIDTRVMMSIVQEKRVNIREQHTLITDVEYGLLLEMIFSDVPNPNTGPVDPACSGPYSIMRSQLHKIRGHNIVKTKSIIMPVPYQMRRGW
ncbi:MAG: hypothetical protein PVJ08_06325 [Dehalococcoidia bacterium]|jgi:hypothetical protein